MTSGTHSSTHPAYNAFDSDGATFWGAMCQRCPAEAAWIGVDFGKRVKVLCVRIVQSNSALQQCSQVALEYSEDGALWIQQHRYGFGQHALGREAVLTPDRDALLDGEWVPPEKRLASGWRLLCNVPLELQWGVYELVFFDDVGCTRNLRLGIKHMSVPVESIWPVENAFDGQEHTLWKTKCGDCDAGDGAVRREEESARCICKRGDAYLGVEFNTPVAVKCAKIIQLDEGLGLCPEFTLQMRSAYGEEGAWVQRDVWKNVGRFEYLVAAKAEEDGADVSSDSTRSSLARYVAVTAAASILVVEGVGLR